MYINTYDFVNIYSPDDYVLNRNTSYLNNNNNYKHL